MGVISAAPFGKGSPRNKNRRRTNAEVSAGKDELTGSYVTYDP
jgi:hypothetical protein